MSAADLANYGDLTFRFLPNNQVIMQDAAGETPGTWSLTGAPGASRLAWAAGLGTFASSGLGQVDHPNGHAVRTHQTAVAGGHQQVTGLDAFQDLDLARQTQPQLGFQALRRLLAVGARHHLENELLGAHGNQRFFGHHHCPFTG